jgi:hypothetical protein
MNGFRLRRNDNRVILNLFQDLYEKWTLINIGSGFLIKSGMTEK